MLAPIMSDSGTTPLLPRDDDIIEYLRSTDFDVRLQTLNRLTVLVKRDPQWFSKFAKKGDLFKQFERLLMDDRWEVQHQCIKLLNDALPTFGNYVEWCVSYLLPCIVTKLGSPKITVRRITNQMLTAYLKLQPGALNTVQKVIVSFLLNNENDTQTKNEALTEIRNLLIAECSNQSWKLMVDGLTEMMLTTDSLERRETIARLLASFSVYLGKEKLQKIISELTDEQQEMCRKYELIIFETNETLKEIPGNIGKTSPMPPDLELRYRFGIIPIMTSSMLNNETDPASRIVALEQVKKIMEEITSEDARKFAAHLHSYFLTLGNVLDDLNFKVVALGLDVLRLTLQKVGHHLAPYTQQIVGLISKHFGNQKSAIKQQIMAICMITMRNCTPKSVISYLCVYLEHKSSRIREEILNIMTASLLTFDSHLFNLEVIADVVVPLLADQKRRVRLAAFELFALLVHLSSGSVESLLKSVANLEQKHRAYGLLSAIKVRISRTTLPRIRSDGLIEYAVPLHLDISLNRDWTSLKSNNLDYDWIMAGNSGSSSAFSRTKWPPVSLVVPNSSISKRKSVDIAVLVADEVPWREDFSRAQTEPHNDSTADSGTTDNTKPSTAAIRPRSDDYDRFMLNGNEMSRKHREDPLSMSLDRIRLEKLQKGNGSHQLMSNGIKMFQQNGDGASNPRNGVVEEPEHREIPAVNGFAKTTRRSSDANVLLNYNSRSNKITNPDELPIKPSKSGKYYDGYAPSEPAIPTRSLLSLVKKSFSQQNLASTSKTNGASQDSHPSIKRYNSGNLLRKLKPASSVKSLKSVTSSVDTSKRTRGIPSVEKLMKNPEAALGDALRKMSAEEWNEKLGAIEVIVSLSELSPTAVAGNIHNVVLSLLNECKNLRSTVSRAAIAAFGTLFKNLKTVMDSDIEKVCLVLMQKAGDVSSAFIRDDATLSLEEMIKYASPGRALNALVSAGAKSKSTTIRACCANLLVKLLERVGPASAIHGSDFSRFITALLLFAKDPNATVRYSGKYGIKLLSQNNTSFDDAARKALNETDRQNLREILETINRRGLEMSNLDSSTVSLGALSRSGSTRRANSSGRTGSVAAPPISQGIQQDLAKIRSDLIANEWKRRMKGLKEFAEMVSKNGRAATSDTKVVEAFIGRTSDINSKVSLEAIQILITIIPTLSSYFSKEASLRAVLNQLINSLMSHLGSHSEEHRQHAKLCIEEITKYIENAALLTSFAAATRQANVKQKSFMLQILGRLNESVYPSKPRQVEVTGLPVLWELLRTPAQSRSDPNVRDAVRSYAIGLAHCFGTKTLLELSTSHISPSQKAALQQLIS